MVVDDECDAAELLCYHLKRAGYRLQAVTEATTSIGAARAFRPDLVILDIMMPDLSGVQICRILRSDPELKRVPIIFLTARTEEIDRVGGFEAGCDDYVCKPFSMKELILRVRSNLRRARGRGTPESRRLRVGGIVLDVERHRAAVAGRRVRLTLTEFRLVQLLMERLGRVQTRERLLVDVWNYQTEIETRTVDTFVRRVRRKLGREGSRIETVRGVGYRMAEPRAGDGAVPGPADAGPKTGNRLLASPEP